MESGFAYEFYNAGEKIHELISFSISESSAGFNGEDGAGKHSTGYWPLVAPPKSWFKVPAEIVSGHETIRVDFAREVRFRHGKRGIVMLDPNHDPSKEDSEKPLSQYAVAPTKEAVVGRANELWENWIDSVVEQHLQDCEVALSHGNRPRKAVGFTKHCLKLREIQDPGEGFYDSLKKAPIAAHTADDTLKQFLATMAAQNQAMMGIVAAIASGQKVDPMLLKAILPDAPPPKPVPDVEAPTETLEVLGQAPVPLADRINRDTEGGYETARVKVGGKKDRATAAAKALAKV